MRIRLDMYCIYFELVAMDEKPYSLPRRAKMAAIKWLSQHNKICVFKKVDLAPSFAWKKFMDPDQDNRNLQSKHNFFKKFSIASIYL